MPTTSERNALVFLAAVAVVGGGVQAAGTARFVREAHVADTSTGDSVRGQAGQRALAAQIRAVDSARGAKTRAGARKRTATAARPRATPEPVVVDVNRATAEELERLPRVGPALAARIVAWRDVNGPFHSPEDLQRVRGIGPATVALLRSAVTF